MYVCMYVTCLSIVVFVPVHLDGESWLLFKPWERNFIKMFTKVGGAGQSLNNSGPFDRSVVFVVDLKTFLI